MNYLDRGAIVSAVFKDNFILNIAPVGKFIKKSYAIQDYGTYPPQVVYSIITTYNASFRLYKDIPKATYCPITEAMFQIWSGEGI